MKKNILLLFFLSFLSCQDKSVPDSNAKVVDSHASKNTLDYIGVYKGILPCADCEGIETELAINENETFNIKTKYIGKGNKVFIQKGNFTWNKDGNTIILNAIKNASKFYFVGENTLTQLDMSGKKIQGRLAEHYILSKQPNDTTSVETSTDNAMTVDLNDRIKTTTVIKKVNPAIGKYTLAETRWKLVELNGKKIVQKGPKVFFIKLNSKDGKFSAYMGCNRINGSYSMPSSFKLSLSEVMMTRMACPEMSLETNFSAILSDVTSYQLKDETLTFFGDQKKILSKFKALP